MQFIEDDSGTATFFMGAGQAKHSKIRSAKAA